MYTWVLVDLTNDARDRFWWKVLGFDPKVHELTPHEFWPNHFNPDDRFPALGEQRHEKNLAVAIMRTLGVAPVVAVEYAEDFRAAFLDKANPPFLFPRATVIEWVQWREAHKPTRQGGGGTGKFV